jgi:GNAT superfamily N-acetyltransferase
MKQHTVKEITFEIINSIWTEKLWPTRVSKIETHSAMCFLGKYDLKNMSYPATYFGYFIDDQLAGVNSGHLCYDNSYRSRGLYVSESYRNLGIGSKLLSAIIEQGSKEKANFVWSYPKQSAWKCYQKVGFTLASDWHQSENDINAYCFLDLDSSM